MTAWQALVLGAIQGLTEFIPVSSSGHLALAHYLFNWTQGTEQDFAFDLATNVGTLIAVALYFRHDWINLLTQKAQRGMLGLIFLACIPGGLAGIALRDMAETTFRAPERVAIMLAAMGVILLISDQVSRRDRDITRVNLWDAVAIGVAQAFAIMPGVSRSGATIAAGLFRGLNRASSARFSFLLSFPIIAGATLFGCKDLTTGLPPGEGLNFALAIIASAVTGFAAIDFLLKFLQRRSFLPFVIYRIALAVCVFVVVLFRSSSHLPGPAAAKLTMSRSVCILNHPRQEVTQSVYRRIAHSLIDSPESGRY
ncbi:MAG: hypothetical protein AUJ92_02700 [Armatimonadetes bacterium CG2_30_59_28]|nr:undecaprenyl-diphosphate phosphatase [Armatimonadota bacterium]OIO97915.1 MAG: hypothetical protein AUJ92_02700 [Armatimonadetes bacterium CG2_30_59_28]PIU65966.1 MAG: UDP-diphosphatase [Armatimonadetes bacterium CG07_land_8_20_14_0_80_59_28]PIY48282.1 MAG: UDP-diphosphatase [Armatimonadetes bacterium CG_4_10_14_3_um_filter_59_10]PJB71061.1 MAG: UDP-diphosphatase [Armatimonadetes bacterium CG_4_9_14_3_um_filter_58_7]